MPPMNNHSPESETQQPPVPKTPEAIKEDTFFAFTKVLLRDFVIQQNSLNSFSFGGKSIPVAGENGKASAVKAYGQLGARVALELYTAETR